MNAKQIEQNYLVAKERYAALGVDTDKALETLDKTPISLHCWQADDVVGFERNEAASGGIQTTGNYPGRARNIEEVRQDIKEVTSLVGGTFRLNLHETYGDFGKTFVDRDEVGPEHFKSWMEWGKENGLKLDFNSTSFSHPKSGYLTLSNPDKAIRDFWIEHTKRCRRIADAMGKYQGDPCIMNIWIHDGSKDYTVERYRYREILKASLDDILSEQLPHMKSCLEAKLFGIGLEAYTTRNLFAELVRSGQLHRAHIGLDYFDASINRIGAYVIGIRATQKSLLHGLLEPLNTLRKYEDEGKWFERLALLEEEKTLPEGAVYDYYNLTHNLPVGEDFIQSVSEYEKNVLSKR